MLVAGTKNGHIFALDPDNPGAAPDITLGHQRIAGLGKPVSDPVWDDAERVFAEALAGFRGDGAPCCTDPPVGVGSWAV